jgi:hypothetical protein
VQRTVRVFVIPAGAGPATPPAPVPELEVEAATEDALREAARSELARRYARVRAVSFTPTGLVAYVEASG